MATPGGYMVPLDPQCHVHGALHGYPVGGYLPYPHVPDYAVHHAHGEARESVDKGVGDDKGEGVYEGEGDD